MIGWFPGPETDRGVNGNVTRRTQSGRCNHGRPRDCRVAREARPDGRICAERGNGAVARAREDQPEKPLGGIAISRGGTPLSLRIVRLFAMLEPGKARVTRRRFERRTLRARRPASRCKGISPDLGRFPRCLHGGCHGCFVYVFYYPFGKRSSRRRCLRSPARCLPGVRRRSCEFRRAARHGPRYASLLRLSLPLRSF